MQPWQQMQPFQAMSAMGQMQPMQQVACMGQMQPMQAMPMPPMQPTLQPCQQSQPMGQMVPVAQPYLSMSPPTQVIFYPVSNSQVAPDSQQGHQSIQASSTAASSKTKKLRSNSSKTKSPKRSRSRSRGRRRRKHRTRSKSRERRRTRTKSKSRKGPRGHSKTKPKQQRRPETPERPPSAGATATGAAPASDPNWDTWGPWDSSGKHTWPNTSYQSWYGQRSYSAHNTAHSSKGEHRQQSQEKGKSKRQGKGQSKSYSYGHPQAGYHSKGEASGKSQGKGKRKDKGKNDRTSSPNRMPLGQRNPSSSRGPDDRDAQVAEAEDYSYWSQAIQKAREDTSRIPVLAEISPSQVDPPRAVDQDEVQAVNQLILTKDTEVPENISHHMAEILLTKIPAEDLSGDNFSYLEMTDEGIGCTIADISQFLEAAPVFSMPDFSGDRHNLYHYTFSHGTDVKSAKKILAQGVIRPYTWNPQDATDFPSFGFYGLGAVGKLSPSITSQLLKKIWKISKGKQGVVILGEVASAKEHGTLESGGTTDEQHLVRRKAVVKGKERWCFHSAHAHIQAIAMMRPI